MREEMVGKERNTSEMVVITERELDFWWTSLCFITVFIWSVWVQGSSIQPARAQGLWGLRAPWAEGQPSPA